MTLTIDLSAYDKSRFLESTFVQSAMRDGEDETSWRVAAPLILMSVALAAFLRPEDEMEYENQIRGIISELIVYDMLPPDFTVEMDPEDADWKAVDPSIILGVVVEEWRNPDFYADNLIALFNTYKSYLLYLAEKIVQPNTKLIPSNAEAIDANTQFLVNVGTQLRRQADYMQQYSAQIQAVRDGGSGAKN